MLRLSKAALVGIAALLLALTDIAGAGAQTAGAQQGLSAGLLAQLRQGGLVLVFRHGATPNYRDPDASHLLDCATQRNLSKEGREESIAMGNAFRDLEIPVGIVRSSPFCRSADTARLAFGRTETDYNLFGDPTPGNPMIPITQRNIRNMAKIGGLPGSNTIFVGHGGIAESFGGRFMDEGEGAVIRWDGASFTILAYVKAGEWRLP